MPESHPERKTPTQQLQADTQNAANAAKRGSATRPGDSASNVAEAARPAKRARLGNAAGFFTRLNRPQVAVTITETTGAISAAVRVPSQNLSPPPAPQALTLTPQEKEVVRQFTQAKASGNLPLRTEPPPGYENKSYATFYRVHENPLTHGVPERNVYTVGRRKGSKSYLIVDGELAIKKGHLVQVRREKYIKQSRRRAARLRSDGQGQGAPHKATSAVASTPGHARATPPTSQPYDSDDSERTLSDEEFRFKRFKP